MKAVGFKNFRNFEEFPMMPIEGVTFLVGQNNSGKSTFTKACRFLAENLIKLTKEQSTFEEQLMAPLMSFLSTCQTYNRALYAGHNGLLEFSCVVGYFRVIIRLDKYSQYHPELADISYISIEDTIDDFIWTCDFVAKEVKLSYTGKLLANLTREALRRYQYSYSINSISAETFLENDVLEQLKLKFPDRNYLEIENKLATYRSERKKFNSIINSYLAKKDRVEYVITEDKCDVYKLFSIDDFEHQNFKFVLDGETMLPLSLSTDKWEALLEMSNDAFSIRYEDFFSRIVEDFKKAASHMPLYCPAHESPLQSLFRTQPEAGDYAGDIIRAYYNSEYHGQRHRWICKWMKELCIGMDFQIKMENSGFLSVEVTNIHGFVIPLSDLGRGAVQLFLILLRINSLKKDSSYNEWLVEDDVEFHDEAIKERNRKFVYGDKRYRQLKSKTIIFEEPEQNLHPALQSKLADLFADIHKTLGYNVIVETHSEYMIRRTQALIASGEVPFDKNPFHVYYFPQGGLPYDMKYTEMGFFEESFDPGFYDAASELTLTVLKGRKS